MQTRTYPVHTLSMFRLETDDNGRPLLVIISRDDCGQMWEQAFTMDPLMICALRDAMAREHGHAEMPPLTLGAV